LHFGENEDKGIEPRVGGLGCGQLVRPRARLPEKQRSLTFGRQWIGPVMFPFYIKVLSLNLGISLTVVTLVFVALLASGQAIGLFGCGFRVFPATRGAIRHRYRNFRDAGEAFDEISGPLGSAKTRWSLEISAVP
jgi:hypothetical protein